MSEQKQLLNTFEACAYLSVCPKILKRYVQPFYPKAMMLYSLADLKKAKEEIVKNPVRVGRPRKVVKG